MGVSVSQSKILVTLTQISAATILQYVALLGDIEEAKCVTNRKSFILRQDEQIRNGCLKNVTPLAQQLMVMAQDT